MKTQKFYINNIPALAVGEKTDKVFLFIHGKMGCKEEAIAFADVVCEKGFQVIAIDLPEHGERKNEVIPLYPWTVIPELCGVINYLKENYKEISIRANSIGAWFSIMAFQNERIKKALFVSPILDMNILIKNMMLLAGVTEQQLRKQGEIKTNFGETLSWRYYAYVKEHPILNWNTQTYILYADKDNLIDRTTVDRFISAHYCDLTVIKNGEHWFHTDEQLEFLKNWENIVT